MINLTSKLGHKVTRYLKNEKVIWLTTVGSDLTPRYWPSVQGLGFSFNIVQAYLSVHHMLQIVYIAGTNSLRVAFPGAVLVQLGWRL